MELKEGYKMTEVGVIPEDWEVTSLESVATKITDGEHLTPIRSKYGYYLLSARNILNGSISLNDVDYVGFEEYSRIRQRCNPEAGDVLISCSGTIGRVATLPIGMECVMVRSAALVKQNRLKVNGSFVQYFLQSTLGQTQIYQSLNQGAQANLFINHIQKLKIPLPTLSQQTAIATALSDMDALITSLEQLIAKKRSIKQGVMQELLTPKEGWVEKEIGSDIDLLTGFPFQSNHYSSTGIKLLRGSNIKRGVTDWAESITQYWTDITPELKKYLLNEGDIVIAMDGSLVGKSFARLSKTDLPALLLQRVARVRSTTIDMNYLKEFICSDFFTKHCDIVKTSSAIPHISPADIKSFIIAIPPTLNEQKLIAKTLSDMSNEITALTQKLTKLQLLKQGMMQNLLTGKIRHI